MTERKSINNTIAVYEEVLLQIISKNKKKLKLNNTNVSSVFDLEKLPSLSLSSYLNRIINSWDVEENTVIYSMILIDMYCKATNTLLTEFNVFILIVTKKSRIILII